MRAPVSVLLLSACAGEPVEAPSPVRHTISAPPTTLSATKLVASDGARIDYLGNSLAGAGDVDGDGYDDVIVGAIGDGDGALLLSGSAYVWFGGPGGSARSSELKLNASDPDYSDYFSISVGGAGDLNGDGYDDVAIGASQDDDLAMNSGSVYLFWGGEASQALATQEKLTPTDGAQFDVFGTSVDGVGDVDGDGLDDLIVGARGVDQQGVNAGAAYVYYGGNGGLDRSREDKLLPSDGDYNWYCGEYVSRAGDINADGYADVLVAAAFSSAQGTYSGEVYVYYGDSAGVDDSSEQIVLASDGAVDDNFGYGLGGGADLDGDGYTELAVGAYQVPIRESERQGSPI